MAAVESVVEHRREVGPHLGLFAVSDRLNQQLAERFSLELELPKHVENLPAKRLARLFKLLQELVIDVALTSFFCHEVPRVADLCLTNTMTSSKPLFHAIGVPV